MVTSSVIDTDITPLQVQSADYLQLLGSPVRGSEVLCLLLTAVDPDEPNAEKVKEIMLHFEHEVIGQYELPGNRLSRDMYDKLPLPWQVSPPVPAFFEADYVKHDYE